MLACTHGGPSEVGAYERILRDAMAGDPTLFARQHHVEEAWRIIDPIVNLDARVREYEPGTWGPVDLDKQVVPPAGWENLANAAPAYAEALQTA
jgi:glucose-6-phosphate 1-dehydrogenase